jgi:Cellulase (glycosyl hydrolase family 5)
MRATSAGTERQRADDPRAITTASTPATARGARARALHRVRSMIATPPIVRAALAACALAACSPDATPGSSGGDDAGVVAGQDTPAVSAPVDVGRYSAHVFGRGTAGSPVALWFEYKPDSVPSWIFVPRTPERSVAAGRDLSTVDEWLYGLTAGTGYSYRVCTRDAGGTVACDAPTAFATRARSPLGWITVDPASPRHLILPDGTRWVPWGNNYVGVTGARPNQRLVEDQMYDACGMARIDADLARLARIAPPGGTTNSVRMHLQLHSFLRDPTTPDPEALARLSRVIELAEDRGLRVLVTGLNDFYPGDNPAWVGQQTDEATHWATQALWWSSMAFALHDSPGVFGYDLMNEPYVGGNVVHDGAVWWTNVAPTAYCSYGEDPARGSHGTCFGQFVTPDPGTRPAAAVATAWTQQMVHAIRFLGPFANDQRHLVTIGVGAFGLANVFHSTPGVHAQLDFLEPHLYPDTNNGQDAIALAASLAQLTTKPIIAGETFTFGPVRTLITTTCAAGTVHGWIGQYDGRQLGDRCPDGVNPFGCALYDAWYTAQRDFGPTMQAGGCPPIEPAP